MQRINFKKPYTMKKTTDIIFTVLAIAGLFVAVCTVDGCTHEIEARLIGTAAFGIFGYMAGWMEIGKRTTH